MFKLTQVGSNKGKRVQTNIVVQISRMCVFPNESMKYRGMLTAVLTCNLFLNVNLQCFCLQSNKEWMTFTGAPLDGSMQFHIW